jgi:Recombination endonuclease VII
MTPKEKAKDKRLQSTYGITLEEYNKILEIQGGCCAACGRPATAFNTSLNVDHEHFKVITIKEKTGHWRGEVTVLGKSFWTWGNTKQEAIDNAKKGFTKYSVRGLLCPGRHGPAGTCCNRNIGRIDKPVWLRKVLAYLEDPPARKVLTLPSIFDKIDGEND